MRSLAAVRRPFDARSVSLRYTVQAIVGVLVALLLVSGTAIGIARLVVLNATTQLTDRVLPARELAAELRISYDEQQSAVRGYLLTGSDEFARHFDDAGADADRLRGRLAHLLREDRPALDALTAVWSAGEGWHAAVALPVLAGPGGQAGEQAGEQPGGQLEDDDQTLTALQQRLATLEEQTSLRVTTQLATIADAQGVANGVALVTGVLAAVVALGAFVLLRRRLTQPLDRLLTDVQTVAGGDYDHPIRRAGPPELTKIADSVDRMRDSIVEHGERLVDVQHEITLRTEHDRMAKDLHDLIIQRVFGLGLGLTSASRRHPQLQPVVQPLIEETDRIIREVRTVIFDLGRTEATDTLRSQVIDLAEDSRRALGFTPTLEFSGPVDTMTSDAVGTEVLAVLREALSNVARHAKASAAQIRLVIADGALTLTVADDGRGFDPAGPRGNGIANLQARAEKLGGEAEVRPGPERGTVVRWSVPL